jgi:hypothetical protein
MTVRAALIAVFLLPALAWMEADVPHAQTGDAVSVVIDGTPLAVQRLPIRVGGSLFVPVREIFEALGAHVHAHAAEITATTLASAGSPQVHTIVMHVGDPGASVDGSDVTLAYPPALIDGTVYVPLRFVATALGATVRYDAQTHTIFITRAAAVALPLETPRATPTPTLEPVPVPVATAEPTEAEPATPTPIALPTAAIVLRVVREEPARGTTVARDRPEISASFGEPVAAASVRILLDGREITSETTITDRYFIYEPEAALDPGTHEIVVAGRTPLHEAFLDRWSFDSAESTVHNYISGVEPPSGIPVSSPLVISGITRPRARVGMVATSSETAAHFSELAGGSLTDHTIADAHGNFSFRLDLVDTGSGFLDVRLDSTAPGGAVAVKTLRLRL